MKRSAILCLITALMFGCALESEDTENTNETYQEVGTGTAAGKVACWKPSNPGALCTVPTNQPTASGTRCAWSAAVAFAGTCVASTPAGYSETKCDGPEECSAGKSCCMHFNGSTWGSVCQTAQCNAAEPTYDPLHVELCHANSDCWPWRSCVASGPPNHASLPQGLGICK